MKSKSHNWKRNVVLCASVGLVLTALAFAVAHKTVQLEPGENVKVRGTILSRDGDLMQVLDRRSGDIAVVNIKDDTKIAQRKSLSLFSPHRYGRHGGFGGFGESTTTEQDYKEGTLVVDLYDAKTKQLIWRGSAEDTLSSKAEKNEKNLDKGIAKMFKDFPPHSAKG